MKILFLTDNYPPETNAAASRVHERARYWVEWGHDVTVLTSVPNKNAGKPYEGYKNKWYQTEEMDGIKVVRVKTFIAKNEGFALRILDYISYMVSSFMFGLFRKRPDVIVATSPPFLTTVSGCMLSKFRWRPWVFELADLWPESIVEMGVMDKNWFVRSLEALELYMYRHSARVVTLSPGYDQNLIERGIPPEQCTTILNGVDARVFTPQPPDPQLIEELGLEGKFVITYIGNIAPSQAVDTIVRAAAELTEIPDIHFVIVGFGPDMEMCLALAEELGTSNVTFTGMKPKSDMPRYWSITDLSIVHLKNVKLMTRAIPSKIFEAMGCGKPMVFGAPDGNARDIVRESGAGLTFGGQAPEEMAAAISELYHDRDKLQELADNSLKAAPLHTRERQAEKFIQVLEEINPVPSAHESGSES
ncbi:MAG: glycosyltransferase family 4 protein [Pirellulaceae bacterium]